MISLKETGSMNAHIRLISSETVAEDANNHDAHENAEGRDEAPIGLPEEGGSDRNDILGDALPLLVAEPEDRTGRATNAKRGSKKGVAKLIALIAFVWPPKPKGSAPVDWAVKGEGGGERERKEEAPANAAEESQGPDGELQAPAVAEGDRPIVDSDRDGDGAAVAAAAKAKRPVPKRKGVRAAALAARVAIPAIIVLNWPHSASQPVVEPGMLTDGQTKLMAPSAALATAPPREAPNVSRDRPLLNETRRDELNEMLSFRGGSKAADGSTSKADAPAAVPAAQPPAVAEARETAQPARAHPASERSAVPPSAPEATPPAPIDQAKSA
jgi:hypothetical protein